MAYKIKLAPGVDGWQVQMVLQQWLSRSRFWAREVRRTSRLDRSGQSYDVVTMHRLRLKRLKPYCGNHPGPCALSGHAPNKRGGYLEGADWVALHDMVNDLLDQLEISADVSTSWGIWVRKGYRRRTKFWADALGTRNATWHRDDPGWYIDNRGGVSIRSQLPDATPGIPEWTVESESRYAALFCKHGQHEHAH